MCVYQSCVKKQQHLINFVEVPDFNSSENKNIKIRKKFLFDFFPYR